MYELKKNGKVFTSKSVWTGPSSCEKGIYRLAFSQRLRNTALEVSQFSSSTRSVTDATSNTTSFAPISSKDKLMNTSGHFRTLQFI